MTNITQQELQDAPDHWNEGLNEYVKTFLTDLCNANPFLLELDHVLPDPIQDLNLKLKVSETHTDELQPLTLVPIYDYQNNKNTLTIFFNGFQLKVDHYIVASAAIAFFGSVSINFTRY
jgi:hypothetical protein